jgi:hypothetical protein
MKLNRTLAQWGAILLSAGTLVACGDDDDPMDPGGTPPATPQNVTATLDIYDMTVEWDAVTDADSYEVTIDDGSTETTETTTGTSAVFERVTTGADFTVGVVARNTDGASSAGTASISSPDLSAAFFAAFDNLLADPGLDASAFDYGTQASPPDFTLAEMPAGYAAATLPTPDGSTLIAPVDGRTLEATTYAGAIEPGTALADAWYNGWTVWSTDGSDSRTWDPNGANVIEVTENILEDTEWTSGNVYRLVGPIFVGEDCGPDPSAPLATCDPAVLTIQPGTTITADPEPGAERGSYLVVNRGSQLIADAYDGGDASDPPAEADVIVFTSERVLENDAGRGDWGGIVINGRAPTNVGDEAEGEGESGLYGGTDVNDDSGIIRGVRIEFAGDAATTTDQLNGLALQGVGAGTTISWLQVHYNFDDGIEPFGGAASVDHLVVTGIGDDSVDGTDGYRGFMQYVLGQQRGDAADNGMELSNNGDEDDAEPRSTAVIANATMIGAASSVVGGEIAGNESSNGIQFREGSNYRVYNSIVTGFGAGGVCIRDARTITNALNALYGDTDATSTLAADGLILWNNGGVDDSDDNFGGC